MTRTMSTCTMTGSVPAIARTSQRTVRTAVFDRAWLALTVWKERRALARLDDRALKDIGLSPADVEHEMNRSIFDVPGNRR